MSFVVSLKLESLSLSCLLWEEIGSVIVRNWTAATRRSGHRHMCICTRPDTLTWHFHTHHCIWTLQQLFSDGGWIVLRQRFCLIPCWRVPVGGTSRSPAIQQSWSWGVPRLGMSPVSLYRDVHFPEPLSFCVSRHSPYNPLRRAGRLGDAGMWPGFQAWAAQVGWFSFINPSSQQKEIISKLLSQWHFPWRELLFLTCLNEMNTISILC